MSAFYEYCLTKNTMFVLELQIPFGPLVLNGGAKRQNLRIYAWIFPLDDIPTSVLSMGSQVSVSPYRKPLCCVLPMCFSFYLLLLVVDLTLYMIGFSLGFAGYGNLKVEYNSICFI